MAEYEPPRGFQFGLRGIFGVVALAAVIAWAWPRQLTPWQNTILGCQTTLLFAMAACSWVACRQRVAMQQQREWHPYLQFSFSCGQIGFAYCSLFWLLCFIPPLHPISPLRTIFGLFGVCLVLGSLPMFLVLLVSLLVSLGKQQRRVVLLLRLMSIASICAWIVLIFGGLRGDF